MTVIFIILAVVIIWILIKYLKYRYKFGVVNMINGGVKVGKTNLVVYLAIMAHKKSLIKYYLKYSIVWLLTVFNKKSRNKKLSKLEKPLIYSNIPIKSRFYVPLTNEIIKRESRIRYSSSVILSEISLIANSMCYKDDLLNEQIELFIKLFGHETHNGTLWIDTQALGDNHYSVKRSIDSVTWIEKNMKIPFIMVYFIHRLNICDEQNVTNTIADTTQNTHLLFVPKANWKRYDRFCYSKFTDSLKIIDKCEKPSSLKVDFIPTFRNFRTLNLDESSQETKNEKNQSQNNIEVAKNEDSN